MADKRIKMGFIGISGRGSSMLKELLCIDYVDVVAVCDKYQDRANHGAEIVMEKRQAVADVYFDYKELLSRDDIEAVVCCTTWITHARIAVDAMKAGKHVAFEVGGASSIEECWQLVRTSEETGKNCMLLENCCYDRHEMAIFNMKQQGVLGEIVHLEGGYRHDLRGEIGLGRENRHGRLKNFMHRNGDLYPTHQLGPICKLIDINRGNRMLTLTSMSSKAVGLNVWLKDKQGEDYDIADYPFSQGDVTTTMIKCANGETIVLTHDCTLPRPYSRDYTVQGTKGIVREISEKEKRIYLEDISEKEHQWEDFGKYLEEYEHPLWKSYGKDGVHASGHGGMDFLVLSAFADCVKNNIPAPIDVYDAALWMAVTALSEQSIALGSAPVAVPDFTNGMWIDREETVRSKYCVNDICKELFEEK